jgi:hypothetical protein
VQQCRSATVDGARSGSGFYSDPRSFLTVGGREQRRSDWWRRDGHRGDRLRSIYVLI